MRAIHIAQYTVHNNLEKIQENRSRLMFRIEWVHGHMNIDGNDKADEEAKRAAKEKLQRETPNRV